MVGYWLFFEDLQSFVRVFWIKIFFFRKGFLILVFWINICKSNFNFWFMRVFKRLFCIWFLNIFITFYFNKMSVFWIRFLDDKMFWFWFSFSKTKLSCCFWICFFNGYFEIRLFSIEVLLRKKKAIYVVWKSVFLCSFLIVF